MLEDTPENLASEAQHFSVTTPNNVTAPENSAFNEQRYDPAEVPLFDGSHTP